MFIAVAPRTRSAPVPPALILWTGLLTGVTDGVWATVLTLLYGRSVARLWQGVAATAFDERMLDGGAAGVAAGIAVHFGVAITWSTIFLFVFTRSGWLRRVNDAPFGPLKIGALYGPFIWIVMSALVIPVLTGTPLVMTPRWWIQLAGHALFVGLPIAWSARAANRSTVIVRAGA